VKRRIVLLGPPASGKGTLADRLSSDFDLPIVSPGNLLRAAKEAGTPAGLRAHELTSQGRLVDDETINGIISEWMSAQSGDGFVFDGYPRTLGQATALDELLDVRHADLQAVVLLEATDVVLLNRVANRAICRKCGNIVSVGVHVQSDADPCPRCGGQLARRADDNAETLRHRLAEYEAKTAPLINYYERRNLLVRVDTNRPADQVYFAVKQMLS
jgi:adenylate kinase